MNRAQRKEWNRLDNGLRELDIDPPKDLTDAELIAWARRELMTIASNPTVEPKDRIAAHRALLSSGHAGEELRDRREARNAGGGNAPTSAFASLPPEQQLVEVERARAELGRLEAMARARLGTSHAGPPQIPPRSATERGLESTIAAPMADDAPEETSADVAGMYGGESDE